jgi:hypothetical protein
MEKSLIKGTKTWKGGISTDYSIAQEANYQLKESTIYFKMNSMKFPTHKKDGNAYFY